MRRDSGPVAALNLHTLHRQGHNSLGSYTALCYLLTQVFRLHHTCGPREANCKLSRIVRNNQGRLLSLEDIANSLKSPIAGIVGQQHDACWSTFARRIGYEKAASASSMIDGAPPISIHSTQKAEYLLEEEATELLRVPLLVLFAQGAPGVLLLRRE